MHSYQQGRAITRPASSPFRPPPPPGLGTTLCRFHLAGNCTFGQSCHFRHSTASPERKQNSSPGTSFAASRRYAQQQTAVPAPSAPSPSRRGVTAPSISSGGRGGGRKPVQLTPIRANTSCARDGPTSNNNNAVVAGPSSDGGGAKNARFSKSYETSSASKRGDHGNKLMSRRSANTSRSTSTRTTNPAGASTKKRRGDAQAFGPGGQPSCPNKDSAINQEVKPPPSDEDAKNCVAARVGAPTDTTTTPTAGDVPTMTRVGDQDQEGVAVGGDPLSIVEEKKTKKSFNYDDIHPSQTPIFNPKASSKGNSKDIDGKEEEEDDVYMYDIEEDLAQYWHEDITTIIIAHEELTEILKRRGEARVAAAAKAGEEMVKKTKKEKTKTKRRKGKKVQSDQGKTAHKSMEDDARSNSNDATTSIDVANNNNVKGTGGAEVRAEGKAEGNSGDGVTDTTGGATSGLDAENDQDKTTNEETDDGAAYTATPKKMRCRCFCPPELSKVNIYLPCPNFQACRLAFCPFQHKTEDFKIDRKMAERGKSIDDVVMGVHDEKFHVPEYYEGGGCSPDDVPLNTLDILCKFTSAPVSTIPTSSDDAIILCQPIASTDTPAAPATTSTNTSLDVKNDGKDWSVGLSDPYYYDENGKIKFYAPPSIPDDPRTPEELHWEDPDAYSRESIARSWNYVVKPESNWLKEKCDLEKACRDKTCRLMHVTQKQWEEYKGCIEHVDSDVDDKKKKDKTRMPMGDISHLTAELDNDKLDAHTYGTGVGVIDSHSNSSRKKEPSRNSTAQRHRKEGRKAKGGKKAKKFSNIPKHGSSKLSKQSKRSRNLNPSATEFVPSYPTTTAKTAMLEVGASKKQSRGGKGSCLRAKIDDYEKSLDDAKTGTTCANSKDSTFISVQSDAHGLLTERPVSNVDGYTTALDVVEMRSTTNVDAADAARLSEVTALSIAQDQAGTDRPRTHIRKRSEAFDLSSAVSPPAASWSSPTRFQGADKEVILAIRKNEQRSDKSLNFREAVQKESKKLVHPECTSISTHPPPIIHDGKIRKKSGDMISASTKENAVGVPTAFRERTIKSRSNSEVKNSIKNDAKAIAMPMPAASITSDTLSNPTYSSPSTIDPVPTEPTVDGCLKLMEDMEFSSSVMLLTEKEFRARKPGAWTEDNFFSYACHFSQEEELNNFALEEHSLHKQDAKSKERPACAKSEVAVKEIQGIGPEDCLTKVPSEDKKKVLAKENKAAKKKRKKVKKGKKEYTSPSKPSTIPPQDRKVTEKKASQSNATKKAEKSSKQESKTPAPSESQKSEDGVDRANHVKTKRSSEARARFVFWRTEQSHRDMYTENLLKLIAHEYSRLHHCDNPEDALTCDVLLEAFEKECTKVYDYLYNYRIASKSTVIVANDHTTLAGRSGKIVRSDSEKHEFEVEFYPNKQEKLAKRSAATRMKISAYDLALPETIDSKGRGRGSKRAKKNKSTGQVPRPTECTLRIEEDEANDIQGFSMVVTASTLNELAGLKDSETFTQRLSEIMQHRDQQEENAKALREEKEQTKIQQAEEQEKKEVAQRFFQYEKEIKGRSKKARRILSSGKSNFLNAIKGKSEDFYEDSAVRKGFVDVLVVLFEREDDESRRDLIAAILDSGFRPNATEYDTSGEITRTCVLFEDDNNKIPLCILDYEVLILEPELDSVMERDQFDELCSETGLSESDAEQFVLALVEMEINPEFRLPCSVVYRLMRTHFLDQSFVNEVFSRDERRSNEILLRVVRHRLSKNLSFNLSDHVRSIARKKLFEIMPPKQEHVSDCDEDSGSTEATNEDLLNDVVLLLLDNNLVRHVILEKKGDMTGEILLALLDHRLQECNGFSFSQFVKLERDDESQLFIEEIPSADEASQADDTCKANESDAEVETDTDEDEDNEATDVGGDETELDVNEMNGIDGECSEDCGSFSGPEAFV